MPAPVPLSLHHHQCIHAIPDAKHASYFKKICIGKCRLMQMDVRLIEISRKWRQFTSPKNHRQNENEKRHSCMFHALMRENVASHPFGAIQTVLVVAFSSHCCRSLSRHTSRGLLRSHHLVVFAFIRAPSFQPQPSINNLNAQNCK